MSQEGESFDIKVSVAKMSNLVETMIDGKYPSVLTKPFLELHPRFRSQIALNKGGILFAVRSIGDRTSNPCFWDSLVCLELQAERFCSCKRVMTCVNTSKHMALTPLMQTYPERYM